MDVDEEQNRKNRLFNIHTIILYFSWILEIGKLNAKQSEQARIKQQDPDNKDNFFKISIIKKDKRNISRSK